MAALGEDAFAAAFERGRHEDERDRRAVSVSRDVSAERGARSARSWMVRVVPQAAGPDSRRIS